MHLLKHVACKSTMIYGFLVGNYSVVCFLLYACRKNMLVRVNPRCVGWTCTAQIICSYRWDGVNLHRSMFIFLVPILLHRHRHHCLTILSLGGLALGWLQCGGELPCLWICGVLERTAISDWSHTAPAKLHSCIWIHYVVEDNICWYIAVDLGQI